ncbi:MAG: TolC family protein, partial [Candidatus Eremiobacteraeota bacterium]|nr:TolC family protein [Candidatus Eremiobacteraeota bacterium]
MAPTPFLDAIVLALRQDPTVLIPADEAAIGRLNEIDAVRRISGTAVVDGSVSDTLHDTRIRESFGPSVNAELAILDGGLRHAEAAIAALEVQQAGVDQRTDAIAAFAQVGSVYDALWQAQRSTTVLAQQERDAAADVRTLAAANRLGGVGRIDVERARAQE